MAIGVNNPLIVETGTFTNNGLLSATGPAGLQIVGTMVNGSGGGQITANAPGAVVQLNDAHLMGGTLRTAGSGAQIEAVGQSSILDGTTTTLGNTGTVSIAGSGTALQIIGTINNSGTFTISGGGSLVIGTTRCDPERRRDGDPQRFIQPIPLPARAPAISIIKTIPSPAPAASSI